MASSDAHFFVNLESFLIHTSNILNWSLMRNKKCYNSSEEVIKCCQCVVNCWKKLHYRPEMQYSKTLQIECRKHVDPIPESQRAEIRVTVKIFLYSQTIEDVNDAIDSVFKFVPVRDLDTIVLAFSPWPSPAPSPSDQSAATSGATSATALLTEVDSIAYPSMRDVIWPVWKAVSKRRRAGQIQQIGLSDFNQSQLEALLAIIQQHNAELTRGAESEEEGGEAEGEAAPPAINQVLCCGQELPASLKTFCQQHRIHLLTHADKLDILPAEKTTEILYPSTSPTIKSAPAGAGGGVGGSGGHDQSEIFTAATTTNMAAAATTSPPQTAHSAPTGTPPSTAPAAANLVSGGGGGGGGALWQCRWLARYSSCYKNRGIICNKGYVLRCGSTLFTHTPSDS